MNPVLILGALTQYGPQLKPLYDLLDAGAMSLLVWRSSINRKCNAVAILFDAQRTTTVDAEDWVALLLRVADWVKEEAARK